MPLLDRIAKQKEYDAAHPEEALRRKEEAERRRAEEESERKRLAAEKTKEEAKLKAELEAKKAKERDKSREVKKPAVTESKPVKALKSVTKPVKVEIEVEPLLTEKQGIYTYIPDLLVDKTTGENIIFAEDGYEGYVFTDHYTENIMKELIASKQLNYRVRKSLEHQKSRTKKNAEVFTPSWICEQMIEMCEPPEDWQEFIQSTWLEITCGECPYLVNLYDSTTGEKVPIDKRIGILDRKFRLINKHIVQENFINEQAYKRKWIDTMYDAMRTTYGYEFQGDNLFIARVNVLRCFVENFYVKWNKMPPDATIRKAIEIIQWNLWQMDGLKDTVPFSDTSAKIMDWKLNEIIEFRSCKEKKEKKGN